MSNEDPTPRTAPDALGVVLDYHERTKHCPGRYAAGPGGLDWANQPDPFRRYAGAALIRLPLTASVGELPYWQLYVPGAIAPQPVSLQSIALLFRYALSLTAWKRFGDNHWSLRANPSSGNLHPTEGYAVLPALAGLGERSGVYHYAAKEHGLERRAQLDVSQWASLMRGFPPDSFLVGLSSIHWREAWKYGERSFRYCQHDVGHALAGLRIAAAALGWRLQLLAGVGDAAVAQLFGLDRDADFAGAEREAPDLVALVSPAGSLSASVALPSDAMQLMAAAEWSGRANALSPDHRNAWPVIDRVARATLRSDQPAAAENFARFPSEAGLFEAPVRRGTHSAEQVILGRRSAVDMDGATSISRATLYRMLARLVPTRDANAMPWDMLPWRPRIHLILFVHRVRDLAPGVYALVRDPDKLAPLRAALGPDFDWQRAAGSPAELNLYLLAEADCRGLAASVSCGQKIAGDGAFSLAMLSDYTDSLASYGPAHYRHLFWEAGAIGQVFYLEAEEADVRATGIGCYFDDAVHEVLGLRTRDWQSFYHLSLGGAVDDARRTTEPAY